MKQLISIITGIIIFCLGFWISGSIINWAAPIGELHNLIVVILWIICFSSVFAISVILGFLIGGFLYAIFESFN